MSQERADVRRGPETAEEVERIENRICHALAGQLRGFRLEVRATGVILHGRARAYYARQLAQHAVMAATNLPILQNKIEVM